VPKTQVRRPKIALGNFKWGNAFILVVFPIVAVAASGWYVLDVGITWREPLAAVVLWWLTGLGITAGYHRHFAHRGYEAKSALRYVYAFLGGAACQNCVISWASDHRYHHATVDTDGDPYDATRGFFWSHMGWVFFEGPRGETYENVPDLRRDKVLMWQHRNYVLSAGLTNLALIGLATLLLGHALGMFIIAGLLRIVVVQHFTFLINSAAHKWGSQPWSSAHTARDNWLLAFLTLGEGYHNFHHTFGHDYRNGVRWYQFDPTKWLIWSLSGWASRASCAASPSTSSSPAGTSTAGTASSPGWRPGGRTRRRSGASRWRRAASS